MCTGQGHVEIFIDIYIKYENSATLQNVAQDERYIDSQNWFRNICWSLGVKAAFCYHHSIPAVVGSMLYVVIFRFVACNFMNYEHFTART